MPEFLRAAPRGLLVWQEFFYGLILILATMFMPRGLWGLAQAWSARAKPRATPAPAAAAPAPAAASIRQAAP